MCILTLSSNDLPSQRCVWRRFPRHILVYSWLKNTHDISISRTGWSPLDFWRPSAEFLDPKRCWNAWTNGLDSQWSVACAMSKICPKLTELNWRTIFLYSSSIFFQDFHKFPVVRVNIWGIMSALVCAWGWHVERSASIGFGGEIVGFPWSDCIDAGEENMFDGNDVVQ